MGDRGPKPAPSNVHLLKGNPSKKPLAQLLGEFKPDVEIPDCPAHLRPEARKEWKRITPELERYGLISKIDRAALALYCQAWAWMVYHELQLRRAMKAAAEKQARFEAAEDAKREAALARGETYEPAEWMGGDGFMLPTPNGSWTYSPHWVGKNKAAEQVDKYLASFGLSPSARSRVSPSDAYPFLPGLAPTDTGGEQGAKRTLASLVR